MSLVSNLDSEPTGVYPCRHAGGSGATLDASTRRTPARWHLPRYKVLHEWAAPETPQPGRPSRTPCERGEIDYRNTAVLTSPTARNQGAH
jgi:hypothetical protein